jgi:hypothetical protein
MADEQDVLKDVFGSDTEDEEEQQQQQQPAAQGERAGGDELELLLTRPTPRTALPHAS